MEYIIYKMVGSSRYEPDGYHTTTVINYTLEKLSMWDVESTHASMEMALQEIANKSNLLKGLQLTVIPVIEIPFYTFED